MQQIMITGSNRGVGLALVKDYLSRGNVHIFATCRTPNAATELQALQQANPDTLTIVPLEINDTDSIEDAAKIVSEKTDKLDLLINNAGIFPRVASDSDFGTLERDALNHVMTTNSVSPVLVTQAVVGLLKNGDNPRVLMVSSKMGSISLTGTHGFAYRMSKASLNMAAKILSISLADDGISVVTTHPGHVSTDMGGSSAPVTAQASAAGLAKIAENLTPAQTGKFYNYTGEELPW